MGEVVVLETERATCRASVVERLEEALEAAREGKIVAVGIAGVAPDGGGICSQSDCENVTTLIGAVEILRARMLRSAGE